MKEMESLCTRTQVNVYIYTRRIFNFMIQGGVVTANLLLYYILYTHGALPRAYKNV